MDSVTLKNVFKEYEWVVYIVSNFSLDLLVV